MSSSGTLMSKWKNYYLQNIPNKWEVIKLCVEATMD